MMHQNNHSLSLHSFAPHTPNIFFCVGKTLIILLVIRAYGNLAKYKIAFSVAASKTSASGRTHVDDDNYSLAVNNFNRNYFSKNQIIFDTLELRADEVSDNDLLSLSMESGIRARKNSYGIKSCASNVVTSSARITTDRRMSGIKLKLARQMAHNNITANAIANIAKDASSSSSSFASQPKATSSLSLPASLLLQQQHFLLRPKRYLSFPEGSSFSVAVCFTVGIIGNPRYNYMSFGLNWGVAYDLPNNTWILNHLHGFAKRPVPPVAVWRRRSRRSLYKEIENVVDNMGYNGRDCVLRALCESRRYFQRSKMSMIGEMLRVIFSLPKQRIFTRELMENGDIELYDRAFRKANLLGECYEQYDCSFSLLELAFGKYSTPPDSYYTIHE